MAYKMAWWVLRYWMNGSYIERDGINHKEIGDLSNWCRSHCTSDYVGMLFPKCLYPTKKHLPTCRRDIPLFPELDPDS